MCVCDDVGSLDTASLANRSSDDHLLEVLVADQLRTFAADWSL